MKKGVLVANSAIIINHYGAIMIGAMRTVESGAFSPDADEVLSEWVGIGIA